MHKTLLSFAILCIIALLLILTLIDPVLPPPVPFRTIGTHGASSSVTSSNEPSLRFQTLKKSIHDFVNCRKHDQSMDTELP